MLDLALNERVMINDDLDCALQELDLLFNTENTELLGMPEYGFNIDPYLFTLTPAADALQDYITKLIEKNTFMVKKFRYNVNVTYINGDYNSSYLIQITIIDTTGLAKTRNYKFG